MDTIAVPICPIKLPYFKDNTLSIDIKREDLIHQKISGNKYWKLKYNLIEAQKQNYKTLLTFGGAYSNHILATAACGKEYGLQTIGIIRGEEIENKWQNNETLKQASKYGMKFLFLNRELYHKKDLTTLLDKINHPYYLIPEGGTNELAIKGTKEMMDNIDKEYDIISLAVGTGGTMAGVLNAVGEKTKIIGFSALKGINYNLFLEKYTTNKNYEVILDQKFGGYAKVNEELVDFLNEFHQLNNFCLDPIYTGKMMYGIQKMLIEKKINTTAKILTIHTGGIQGIQGINNKLLQQQKPLITC